MSVPRTKYPRRLIPDNYWPPQGKRHEFQTGERWESVAAQHGVPVAQLIYHNFKTTQPEEVNWYLHNLIGCKFSTDGRNHAFKTGEAFGYIVVPLSIVNMEPEIIEVPVPISEVERLKEIAKGITGLEGEKAGCLLAMAERVGSPADEQWWFYSTQPTMIYTEWRTTDQQRRWMTPGSPNGAPPFDGSSGAATGEWRMYPFRKLKIDCINGCSDTELKRKMIEITFEFHKSYAFVARVDLAQASSTVSPLVKQFVKHVYALSMSPIHLYSCGSLGADRLDLFRKL